MFSPQYRPSSGWLYVYFHLTVFLYKLANIHTKFSIDKNIKTPPKLHNHEI
jgi:hypothetical protein